MRKIETIKNDIAKAEARIAKNTETRGRLVQRFENAKARAIKLGWDYKGDGTDSSRAPLNAIYDACRSADDALEYIGNKDRVIREDNEKLARLTQELKETTERLEAIPQAIKDYEIKLADSLIADRKFRRTWAQGEVEELKEKGEWITRETLSAKWEELDLGNVRHFDDPKWDIYKRLKEKKGEQEALERVAKETDESIETGAKLDARSLVLDLNARVSAYVGDATDCSGLKITKGTHGYAVLNGIVIGTEGRCEVKSKGVAGYNIVRWHIRVNVYRI